MQKLKKSFTHASGAPTSQINEGHAVTSTPSAHTAPSTSPNASDSMQSLSFALETATYDLSTRGLALAARWAAEALNGMPQGASNAQPPKLLPKTLMAKTFFDCHEYDRCWHALQGSTDAIGMFLGSYARYISGEKAREEKPFQNKEERSNPYIKEIYRDIEKMREDPFMLYLKGILLRKENQEAGAAQALIQSVQLYPFNWSCWQELLGCFKNLNDALAVIAKLESSVVHFDVMLAMFELHCQQEFYQTEEAVSEKVQHLRSIFPEFTFIETQMALMHIHSVNYEDAERIFETMLHKDPYRLEELDLYSNLLYVTEQRAKLSLLAQEADKTDKYRAEACCVVANYYSLRGEHEMAVDYYQRALISNPNYLSAWTLLGHEFVEMKNTHAAIESYRTAVTICKRDFRAWYGLGQAYEVLDMASYAHYYYQRALALSPGDTRIWSAMANCYEKMGDIDQAITTYELALRICKGYSYFYYRLGHIFDEKGESEKAHEYFELCAADEDEGDDMFQLQAQLWLARNAASHGKWSEAHDHATAITEAQFISGLEEDARTIVREALYHMRRE